MTQDDLAAALRVGRSTIQKLESGHAYAKVQPVHHAAARAVGWTEDSIEAILAGGEPVSVPDRPTPGQSEGLPDGMSERAKMALLGGAALDTDVIGMAPDDPERGEVVLVYKKPTRKLTPEELRDDMRRWARMQALIRDIVFNDDARPPTP